MKKCDFSGWATKNNLKCSDGRIILKDAFKDNDGMKVPLVWNHQHNDPSNVLGHAILENRNEGVYAYCNFNDTESAAIAKALVEHGDIVSLSIYANQLKQNGPSVLHGLIREVSLVHAGANPGACIDTILEHGDEVDEAIIYTGTILEHAEMKDDKKPNNEPETNNESEETIADVFNTLTDKQKKVVYALIAQAIEDKNSEGEDEKDMKHNVFENDERYDDTEVISHSDMMAVINDAKRFGSLRESAMAHGLDNIDYLFPDAQSVTDAPQFVSRENGWVKSVMNSVHHTPFSRIKSLLADITEDEARAKGYIKGNLKKDEVFSLLKRTTTPTTIYKKQRIDRDDIVDITDFDVVSWIKAEMRAMLDEEIARAILVGDQRLASSDDKINASCIRPILTDAELYTTQVEIEVAADATDSDIAKAFIEACIKNRKYYKGSGDPTMYMTEDMLSSCLLIADSTGRIIYDDVTKLAKALRVKDIVTVPVMDNVTGPNSGALAGIMVNLADYNVGADKGGAVNLFDDFDIDYNAQKYLIETRCSGALIKPYAAIEFEVTVAASKTIEQN